MTLQEQTANVALYSIKLLVFVNEYCVFTVRKELSSAYYLDEIRAPHLTMEAQKQFRVNLNYEL
jgi:hypothetical protein